MTGIASKECNSDSPAEVELSIEAALYNWRRNAFDVFMASSALVYLPVIILVICGHGLPITWPVYLLVYTSYLIVVLAAFLRKLDHRVRLYTILIMAYMTAIFGVVAYPAPFIRALPIALPIIGLVLAGVRYGRLTTAVSATVNLLTPFLTTLPILTMNLKSSTSPPIEPVGLMLAQGVGLTVLLLLLMVLLERFYRFPGKALIDQHQAANDVVRKVLELTKAHTPWQGRSTNDENYNGRSPASPTMKNDAWALKSTMGYASRLQGHCCAARL